MKTYENDFQFISDEWSLSRYLKLQALFLLSNQVLKEMLIAIDPYQ